MPAPPGRDTCRATAAGTSIPGCRRPTLGEPCRCPFSPAGLTALRPCFFSDPLPRPYNLLFWQPGETFLQLVLASFEGSTYTRTYASPLQSRRFAERPLCL